MTFLLKKLEKFSAAIYLLTSAITDTDPIKLRIRKMSLDMVDTLCSISNGHKNEFVISPSVTRDKIDCLVGRIKSYLTVMVKARLISESNYQIISGELSVVKELSSDLTATEGENEASLFLPDGFFSSDAPDIGKTIRKNYGEKSRRKPSDKTPSNVLYSPPYEAKTASINDCKKRRVLIVDLLKDKGSITMKDAARLMPFYSEKTVQRELAAMVEEGLLGKMGERRWSRYFLK